VSDHVSGEQLSLLIDGQLSLASRDAVFTHLRSCPRCAARHDHLIELTASLRLHGRLEWSPEQTAATLQRLRAPVASNRRLRPHRLLLRRDWSLPIAALLACGGIAAMALASSIGATVVAAPAAAVSILPGGSLVSGHLLVALVAAVLVGLLALPLSRSR
jgi:anti-sigma factor RsiW